MSATPKKCEEQVARLRWLNYVPHDERELAAMLSELGNALRCVSDDNAHAQRIVDAWLRDRSDRPTPADLKPFAVQTRQKEAGPPNGCTVCHGAPHVIVTIRGVSAATRCECARGQYLAAKDREREAQQARIVDCMVVP